MSVDLDKSAWKRVALRDVVRHVTDRVDRPGRHLHAQTAMKELRRLGINLHGARNSALDNLVKLAPPPIVADMLGYSYQVTERHAALATTTYARYAQSLAATIASMN